MKEPKPSHFAIKFLETSEKILKSANANKYTNYIQRNIDSFILLVLGFW